MGSETNWEQLEQALRAGPVAGEWPAAEDARPGEVWEETTPAAPAGGAVSRAHARDCAVNSGPGEVAEQGTAPVSLAVWFRQTAPGKQLEAARIRYAQLPARPGTLLDSQPPTFRGALARHRECAGHYDSSFVGGGRMLFGYAHTALVKPVLNYIEWATASPLSLVIHALTGLAVWLGLLWGGYL